MPGISGAELAKTLTRRRPELCTVFMSGYSNKIVAEHGVLEETTFYLQKPFTPSQLLKLVEQALARAHAA